MNADLSALLSQDFDPDTCSDLPFWDDPHISASMLAAHLDDDTDAASRRPTHRAATLAWLDAEVIPADRSLDILDLGCGPGLYARELAAKGHRVTGMDISGRSLAWARNDASSRGLRIDYRQASYLGLSDQAAWDLIILIYCDFGALRVDDQRMLLQAVHAALRPGGSFVFDCIGQGGLSDADAGSTWEWHPAGGFWSPGAHLVLTQSRYFPDKDAVARRHIIIDAQTDQHRVWHLRDHAWGDTGLAGFLEPAGFSVRSIRKDLIAETNFGAKRVSFVHAVKNVLEPRLS